MDPLSSDEVIATIGATVAALALSLLSMRSEFLCLMPQPTVRPLKPSHCPVLIVEDDADLREMMAQLLSLEGYRAETAPNGRDALQYLKRGDRPDVILLDLMMPVMDGWEFRRRQVSDATIAAVPVVVLSALDPGRAGDLGGTAFLKKPLDFDHLLELVRRFCAPTG